MSELALELIQRAKEERSLHLDLANCGLTEIPLEIKELKQLTHLYLRDNQISNIETLKELKKLTNLDLENNQINNIETLKELKKLTNLYLNNNIINNIKALKELKKLTKLHLNNNQISSLTPLLNLVKKGSIVSYGWEFKGISVGGNPLKHPPREIIEQGNPAIISYLESLKKEGEKNLNEAKLIIVGEPNAGKTTLMDVLINPKTKVPTENDSTLGINVKPWDFDHPDPKQKNFTTNIWDFGGQQIQYMTHQFFLTPSAAYILLYTNDRKECQNFPYWFKIIHLLGEEQGRYSPVLVVFNQRDNEFNTQFYLKYYQDLYPELDIEYCKVDLSQRNAKYNALVETIQEQLMGLSHVTDPRPASWREIREDLQVLAKTKDYICYKEYAALCTKNKVTDQTAQLVFSGYLHRLGSLLHFTNDLTLKDFIILNPQWAVDAVYSVLSNPKIERQQGYFNQQDLVEIWEEKYSIEEQAKLLALMKQEHFEICYTLDQHTFIAPQLLGAEEPKYDWQNETALKFQYQYKFKPEGIIARLIVRLSRLLKGDLIWRKGLVLSQRNCSAQIKEKENSIEIEILGDNNRDRQSLLRQIYDEIDAIHTKWFKNIQAEKMIPCVCKDCKNSPSATFFPLSELEKCQAAKIPDVRCYNEPIKNILIADLLGEIFIKKEDNKMQPKVFISYAHADGQMEMNHFWNKLSHYLKTTDQHWDKWVDQEIKVGEKWDNVIQEALNNGCNCCILLVSDLFGKSHYIVNNEWQKILTRYEKEGFIFFPVVFGVLDNLTALPKEMEKFQIYWPTVNDLYLMPPQNIPNPEQRRLCYKEISDAAAQDRFCSRLANQMNQCFKKIGYQKI